jgi:hypothetical protein
MGSTLLGLAGGKDFNSIREGTTPYLQVKHLGRCSIWETLALQAPVIPAKAGIHSANPRKCAVHGLDSRFRGNDRRLVRDDIPNDTTTELASTEFASACFASALTSCDASGYVSRLPMRAEI